VYSICSVHDNSKLWIVRNNVYVLFARILKQTIMVNPGLRAYHEECEGEGLYGEECARLMAKDCTGGTGQFWDNPACTEVGSGCILTPHAELLDPRSNCSFWNLALQEDATDRWQKRNECVLNVTASFTQKCKVSCHDRWKVDRWKPRGAGFSDRCTDLMISCEFTGVTGDGASCMVDCNSCSIFHASSKDCQHSLDDNKSITMSFKSDEYCMAHAGSQFSWWSPELGCEKFGFLWYPNCPEGFSRMGCCICAPDCKEAGCDEPQEWAATSSVCYTFSENPANDYLEDAMKEYCLGDGAGNPECECVQFPVVAKDWCDLNQGFCPDMGPDACPIQEIMYTQGEGKDAIVNVTEFNRCNPYGCWYGPCRSSPHTQLVPPSMQATQLEGSCSGVCMLEAGGNYVNEPPNISPLPPGAYQVNEFLIKKCCGDPAGCITPALLAAQPLNIGIPTDQPFKATFMLNNEGEIGTNWRVKSTSHPWINLVPSYGFLGGHSAFPHMVVWDREAFGKEPGTSQSATVTIEY